MFKNKPTKDFFKTQVVTMCSFSSAKPANIIAMFDTIFKTSRVKCYSFKQSQVFQFRQLHQGWFSLPMLLRAPRPCLASVLPQIVLPSIFPIWSPLDQLAPAPVPWWSQPPGLCQHLQHTLELQPLLVEQLGWCHSQENQLISKQATKKTQTHVITENHTIRPFIFYES